MNTDNQLSGNNTSIPLVRSLDENIEQFQKLFQGDDTFISRFFSNQDSAKPRFCILYIDGMVDADIANQYIIQPLVQCSLPKGSERNMDIILKQVVLSNKAEKLCDVSEIIKRILRGESALFMDGSNEVILVSTRDLRARSIQEPINEQVMRGPREGFVEPILVNLSLIRRKLATPNLKFVSRELGRYTKTRIFVCYLDGVVNHQILDEVFIRLNKIDIDGILDSGNIAELIMDAPYSPFETIGITERPDIAAADLLEGRIVILVDGTPVALTIPFLFEEYFQTDDDYYINFYFSSFNRILRYLSFFLTIASPGIYVAMLTFHHEMIPSPLLFSISAAREGVPFPTIVETIGLLFVFEIMREVGLRVPITIGQTISILGALVLGTAAVEARIVSAPVIILVAITGLTGLITPRIKTPVIIIRFILTLMAGFLGLYGVLFGMIAMFLHLCSLRSFGVPFMMAFTSLRPEDIKDSVIRAPLWLMKKRPRFISGRNRTRKGDRSKSS